jgi:hypothetical protein
MSTSTFEKQIAPVVEGRSNIANVRTARGNLVVLSERMGERFRPLLEYMARQVSTERTSPANSRWTPEKNVRRIMLIEKKYEGTLSAAEKRELKALQEEGDRYADQIAGVRNEVLELLLLGLEHKAAQQKSSP